MFRPQLSGSNTIKRYGSPFYGKGEKLRRNLLDNTTKQLRRNFHLWN